MLSIFPHICWPFVYVPGEYLLNPLPNFQLVCLSFCCWVVRVLPMIYMGDSYAYKCWYANASLLSFTPCIQVITKLWILIPVSQSLLQFRALATIYVILDIWRTLLTGSLPLISNAFNIFSTQQPWRYFQKCQFDHVSYAFSFCLAFVFETGCHYVSRASLKCSM
jgi:hypothetical protein